MIDILPGKKTGAFSHLELLNTNVDFDTLRGRFSMVFGRKSSIQDIIQSAGVSAKS